MFASRTATMLAALRDARMTGRRVALDLDPRCDTRRVEGRVERVAVTGAYTVVDGMHVPLERVVAFG